MAATDAVAVLRVRFHCLAALGDFWLVRLRLCWIFWILEDAHCEVVLPVYGRSKKKSKKRVYVIVPSYG